jgi:hypothetical protein
LNVVLIVRFHADSSSVPIGEAKYTNSNQFKPRDVADRSTADNVQNAVGGEESITGKRINLFKELMPNLTRLGMIGFAGGLVNNLEHSGLQKLPRGLVLRF